MKFCKTANAFTPCTDNCKDCAREAYNDLKAQVGKADYISESRIKDLIGESTFELLKEYGFIETCGVIDGTKVYAL